MSLMCGILSGSVSDRGYVERLTAPHVRVTLVTMDVLGVIVSAPQDDPAWAPKSWRPAST